MGSEMCIRDSQVERHVKCPQHSCLPVQKSILEMVFGGVEKQVRSLPKNRPDDKFLPDSAHNFHLPVNNQQQMLSKQSQILLGQHSCLQVSSCLDLRLSEHFSIFEVVHHYQIVTDYDQLELFMTVKQFQDLHLV